MNPVYPSTNFNNNQHLANPASVTPLQAPMDYFEANSRHHFISSLNISNPFHSEKS